MSEVVAGGELIKGSHVELLIFRRTRKAKVGHTERERIGPEKRYLDPKCIAKGAGVVSERTIGIARAACTHPEFVCGSDITDLVPPIFAPTSPTQPTKREDIKDCVTSYFRAIDCLKQARKEIRLWKLGQKPRYRVLRSTNFMYFADKITVRLGGTHACPTHASDNSRINFQGVKHTTTNTVTIGNYHMPQVVTTSITLISRRTDVNGNTFKLSSSQIDRPHSSRYRPGRLRHVVCTRTASGASEE
ncbi:hypothetical protein CSKR_111540 [Clonorchis sinensis]|uniref:Uncharacterized protein n=2 Tax=Clonorchis sinensis TaxID=79923 RepID=G7Y6V3_CLOSI|nr:hypothetical protein CSKR_111540 [Clonorchis sinensis]GAA48688.1 hypothetical protein CLF_101917 [Clonorchis sinensis]